MRRRDEEEHQIPDDLEKACEEGIRRVLKDRRSSPLQIASVVKAGVTLIAMRKKFKEGSDDEPTHFFGGNGRAAESKRS